MHSIVQCIWNSGIPIRFLHQTSSTILTWRELNKETWKLVPEMEHQALGCSACELWIITSFELAKYNTRLWIYLQVLTARHGTYYKVGQSSHCQGVRRPHVLNFHQYMRPKIVFKYYLFFFIYNSSYFLVDRVPI